ncbi:MAG: hypothetical protein Q6353_001095, partial [Candidatus Sigynarchaeum springense]
RARIDFSPMIFVIDMKATASPAAVVIETAFNFYDASLLVIVPCLVGLCVIVFVIKERKR